MLMCAENPIKRLSSSSQKPAKIGTVGETAWLFGPEDLVKTKFIIIFCKKSMDRAF
jgi:hypothetical protein